MREAQNANAYFKVLAFSLIPAVLGFLVKLLLVLFALPNSDGHSGFANLHVTPTDMLIYYAKTGLVIGFTMIWPTVLTIIGISAIQNFTFMKSLLNFVLGMLAFSVPVFIVLWLYFVVFSVNGVGYIN